LFDAYHVPKLLSQQLSALSARRGQSASVWRTVRCLVVRGVFIVFLLTFVFDPLCFRVLVGRGFERSACAGRIVRWCLADSPRAPRGQSVFRGSLLKVLLAFMDSPRPWPDGPPYPCGQSAVRSRTVRVPCADSPPLLAGRSARAWLLCSLVRFLPPSFVLPRVLQGIVPKT
jgi:hypothetical protein